MDNATATVFSTVLSPRRPQDFRNLRNDWAPSAIDRRIRFTLAPMYDFVMSTNNWVLKNIVGNWNVSGTYTYQSPQYVTIQSPTDANQNNDALDRAVINVAGKSNLSTAVTGVNRAGAVLPNGNAGIVAYVANSPNARYVQAGLGVFPNSGRNTFSMNPINNVDFQALKRFNITESKRFEIGMQATNLLNHPQWSGDLLNDVYPNVNNNTRSYLETGNVEFGRFDHFFTSNPRTITIVGRIVF